MRGVVGWGGIESERKVEGGDAAHLPPPPSSSLLSLFYYELLKDGGRNLPDGSTILSWRFGKCSVLGSLRVDALRARSADRR